MNQKKNQRFQETDRKIRAYFTQALQEKPISKITVNEICQNVGINRSSFYLHYPDVYALLEAVSTEVVKEVFEDIDRAGIQSQIYFGPEYLLVILQHVQKHAVLYRAYIEHVGMSPIDRGYAALFENLFKPYFRKLGMESEHRMEYHFKFAVSGFSAVLLQWLRYDCAETPEEMVEILMQSMAPIPADLPSMDGL